MDFWIVLEKLFSELVTTFLYILYHFNPASYVLFTISIIDIIRIKGGKNSIIESVEK